MAVKNEKLLSVTEASEQADVSRQRILQVIEGGLLKAEKVGSSYIIRQSDFETWSSSRRDAGRPPKKKNNE
jgi:excisionase family DNA binding protein